MKHRRNLFLWVFGLFAAASSPAAVLYVDINSGSPAPPYTSWATAATNIQDAVDAAMAGDLILVTNGVYQAGGRPTTGSSLTNRVAVDRPLTIRSKNGPEVTVIQGYQVPGTTNGDAAVRCVYLADGATMSGFTLTNGGTSTNGDYFLDQGGGGILGASTNVLVTNCVITGNSASGEGGGVCFGTLNNCRLAANSARNGGGASRSVLSDCVLNGNSAGVGGGAIFSTLTKCNLTGNSAKIGGGTSNSTVDDSTYTSNSVSAASGTSHGGGAGSGTLNRCVLIGNTAEDGGGGAIFCTLNNCLLIRNSALYGGGAYLSTLNECFLSTNSARYGGGAEESTLNRCMLNYNWVTDAGGGAGNSTLNNCLLSRNSAGLRGGGASFSTLLNCTVSGNSGNSHGIPKGGGVWNCVLTNSIVYYNFVPGSTSPNHGLSEFSFSCSTPQPPGPGNIDGDPRFVDLSGWRNLRPQSNSRCINTGTNAVLVGSTDLDGRPRVVGGVVDMGAYEFQPGVGGEFIGWLSDYGLPTDGLADHLDTDRDLASNWQEWIAGTVPTNSASALRLLAPARDGSGVAVSWLSAGNRTYFLERAGDLGSATSPFSVLSSNIPGKPGMTSFMDTNTTSPGPFIYRVGVQ